MKSFRGARNSQMIADGKKQAQLDLGFFAQKRDQRAAMNITPEKRETSLNKIPQQAASALIGELCFVVFSPDRMTLVTGAAVERRRFVDAAISQTFPRFANILSDFNKATAQRNAIVRTVQSADQLRAASAAWDAVIAPIGARIAKKRSEYAAELSEAAERIYAGISADREKLWVGYDCSFCGKGENGALPEVSELAEEYLKKLSESAEADVAMRYTTKGPQRDDLKLTLDGRDIRVYGSQGQKRSAVLALKLAEAELLSRRLGEQPIALLDDVMSELDASRQRYLLNKLEGWQVMITCCDPAPLKLMDKGSVWNMAGGVITKV